MKINKWWIFLAILLIFIVSIGSYFIFMPKRVSFSEIISCNTKNECILTFSKACCFEIISVNKKYSNYWDDFRQDDSLECGGIKCNVPNMIDYSSDCINNNCTAVKNSVNIQDI